MIQSWLGKLLVALWWIFTRLWAPAMAIAWPLFAIYGLSHTRPADMTALNIKPGEVAIYAGEGTGGTQCDGNQPCVIIPPQRDYIVFPRVLSDAAVVIVEDKSDGLTVTRYRGYALMLVIVWIICGYGTWYYWIRPFVAARRASKTFP